MRRMAHNISVSEEVYELLRRSKLPGESFSAVIKRNMKRERLADIAGTAILTPADWATTKKTVAEDGELTDSKLAQLFGRPYLSSRGTPKSARESRS